MADKKEKKGKKDKGAPAGGGSGPSLAAYPRAARSVRRAKSWGGLLGFLAGGYLSMPTHALSEAALRAIIAGSVCYVATWAGAVFLWRRFVYIEIMGRRQQLIPSSEQASGGGPGGSAPGA